MRWNASKAGCRCTCRGSVGPRKTFPDLGWLGKAPQRAMARDPRMGRNEPAQSSAVSLSQSRSVVARFAGNSVERYRDWTGHQHPAASQSKIPDAIVAATAIHLVLPLVSRNIRDFSSIEGLSVIHPFEDAPR